MTRLILSALVASATLLPTVTHGGSFIFAGETNPDQRLHTRSFAGQGGDLVPTRVCIDTQVNSAMAIAAEPGVIKVINTMNRFRSLPAHNFANTPETDVPVGMIDVETVILHEFLHVSGLTHPNHADESGLPGAQSEGTKSTDGVNNVWNQDAGADGLHGSSDDLRGDDVNLHWYQRGVNNPAIVPGIVDDSTMGRTLNFLPGGHLFAANADVSVMAALGFPNSESALQQGLRPDEVQRHLHSDDVTTMRFARAGIDGVQGTNDDYRPSMRYVGRFVNPQGEGCQVAVRFDTTAALATTTIGGFRLSDSAPNHWGTYFSRIKFNPLVNWYFTSGQNTVVNISADTPDPSVQLAPITVNVTVTKAAGNSIPGEPGGLVEVRDGERHDPLTAYCNITLAGTVGEVGSCVLTPLRAGAKAITAEYLGHRGFDGGSDTEAHVATATLAFSNITHTPEPSAVNANVRFDWTFAPPVGNPPALATGLVLLKEAGDCASAPIDPAHQCSVTLPNHGCDIRFVSTGAKSMVLCYSGDGAIAPASASVSHQVIAGRATTTTITANTPNPAASFAPITVSFRVQETPDLGSNPGGVVTVRDGPASDLLTASCSATLSGSANEIGQCTFSPRRAGNKTLTASFAAQGQWAPSSGSANQAVRSFSIARNQPNNSRVGQGVSVTVNLDVAPYLGAVQPSGMVTVSDGVDQCQVVLPATECLWVGSSAGIRNLVATWPGDGNYPAMTTAPVNQNVVANSYPQLVSMAQGSYADSNGGSSATAQALSADGRFLVFASAATQLVNGDSNGATDVFVRDLMTGAVRRVSTDALGVQGNGVSDAPSISADGRFVAFQSLASNLVPGDGNGGRDVFVKDLTTGGIVRVTAPGGGSQPTNNFSMDPSLSADGRYVAFATFYVLVPQDVNGENDIYVADLQTGTFDLVSTNSDDRVADFRSFTPVISSDGRHVAFVSMAYNLVPNVPVKELYIAVYAKDRLTRTTRMVSASATGTYGDLNSQWRPGISADGRHIAFMSHATNLIPGDANNDYDIFVKDMQTGAIERVNNPPGGGMPLGRSEAPAMSADARYVAFRSVVQNLVAGDTNSLLDVFVKDRQTNTITRLNVTPANGQITDQLSDAPAISADGRFVSYVSASAQIANGDGNGLIDVFVRDRQSAATVRASEVTGGTRSDGPSDAAAISRDGRFVAFSSSGSTLVNGDANGVRDVFLHDRDNISTARLSLDVGGVAGNAASDSASISADQNWIAFRSAATNLVVSDGNALADVFVKNRVSGAISRVSTASNGASLTSGNVLAATSINGDGNLVAFAASDANIVPADNNTFDDVFLKNRSSDATVIISRDGSVGALGNGHSGQAMISEDGTRVVFASDATNFVGDDSNAARDVYIKTLASNVITRVSSNASGVQGNAASSEPAISADGRFVAFISAASDLVAGDSNGNVDVFVKDLSDNSITRVNLDAAGGQGSGGDCSAPSLSSDARHVGFICAQNNLVAGDTNALADAYVKDRISGAITRLPISAVSAQANALSTATSMAISDNGFAAFASSANNLVVADEQLFSDVFVNRYNAAPLIATTTVITADTPDPSQPNVAYAVSVAVTRTSGANPITGGVTISDGSAFCAAPLSGSGDTANGQCNLVSTTLGPKTLTATYSGDANYSGSNAPTATHAVSNMLPTTLDLYTSGTPAVAGNLVTLTVFIAPNTARGTMLFAADTQTINGCGVVVVDAAGAAVCNTAFTSVGTRVITASYSGDAAHLPSIGTLPGGQQVIAPTITIAPALVDGATNVPYGPVQLLASGGVAPHQFAVTAGNLPNGLNLSSSGLLSGIPSLRGAYNFTVTATDANGFTGTRNYDLTLRSVPDAPTIGVLTAGNGSVTVTFTQPANDGGSPITIYNAFCSFAASSPTSPITVNGLPNGVPVRCRVNAVNAIGGGAASEESNEVTPQAPTTLQLQTSGTPANAGASVTFIATVSSASASGTVAFAANAVPISTCASVPVNAGSAVCNTTFASTGTRAITASYSGDTAHVASNGILVGDQDIIDVPGAPLILSAAPLDQAARISFNAPISDGGSAILDYSASCTPGPISNTQNALVIDVGGLNNNVVYRCSVRARNAIGLSVPSAELSVIPGSGGSSADLAISKTNSAVFVNGGAYVDYTITVSNPGPAAVIGARVEDAIGAGTDFSAALWTCAPLNNAACPNPANGSGALNALVDLPATSSVQFVFGALPNSGPETPIANSASVTPPANITDPNLNNNIASDGPDIRGIFRNGFE